MSTEITSTGRTRRRRPIVIGVALVLSAVLAVGGYWFFTVGPGWPIVSPRGSTVATFSGEGDLATPNFRVREGWRISWETTGQSFALGINGDVDMGTVLSVEGPDSGVTAPPGQGTFMLQILANGPWTATIQQGR